MLGATHCQRGGCSGLSSRELALPVSEAASNVQPCESIEAGPDRDHTNWQIKFASPVPQTILFVALGQSWS